METRREGSQVLIEKKDLALLQKTKTLLEELLETFDVMGDVNLVKRIDSARNERGEMKRLRDLLSD